MPRPLHSPPEELAAINFLLEGGIDDEFDDGWSDRQATRDAARRRVRNLLGLPPLAGVPVALEPGKAWAEPSAPAVPAPAGFGAGFDAAVKAGLAAGAGEEGDDAPF